MNILKTDTRPSSVPIRHLYNISTFWATICGWKEDLMVQIINEANKKNDNSNINCVNLELALDVLPSSGFNVKLAVDALLSDRFFTI